MSRKTIITGAIAAVVAVALMSSAALAARGNGAGMAMAGGRGTGECRMADRGMRPSFTSEQKEQMEKIRAGFEEQRVELQNRMKVLHVKMQDLAESDNPDFGKLERMIDDAAELRAELTKLKLKQHVAIRAILDDDQRVLFDRGIARTLSHGGRDGMRGGMRGDRMNAGTMGRRGGRMNACPMGKPGGMMGANSMDMSGGRMFRGSAGEDECIIMIKGDPEKMGDIMNWETDEGELIEFLKGSGDETERRVIVKKIVDGDEVIIEFEEDE